MSLFAGIAAGWGEAQGQHNQKLLDFMNQKSQTMAQLYGHLAENATDQDVAAEFMNRAKGWASANPILDPKGYQQLIKGEKTNLHDIVDRSNQAKIVDYHQKQFGVAPTQPVQPGQNTQTSQTQQGQSGSSNTSAPIQAPTIAPFTGKEFAPGMEPVSASSTVAPTSASSMPPVDASMAPQGAQSNIPIGGGPPTSQNAPSPTTAPPMTIQDYVKSVVGPEPPVYGAMGKETLEHQMWREAYQKRLEGTIPTPTAMQPAMGSPFMPSGFASPYLSFMGREAQANSRLASSGYKMVNGQVIPLNPDEYSMAAQLKMQKDQMSSQLMAASVPLRKALTDYYGTKTQVIPMELKLKLQQLGVAMAHLKLSEEMTNARLFSVGPDGSPLPGSLVIDGVPVSPMLSKNVMPTNATQNRAETAIPAMEQIDSLSRFVKENPDLFGIVQGNFMNWLASGKNMTNDPREGELRASIISLASLMVPLHGFRSQRAAEEFMGRLSQGMSPEGFASALQGFKAVTENIYQNGMPSIVGGNQQVRPRLAKTGGNLSPQISQAAPQSPKYKPGDVFLNPKDNKHYKVTKVNPDGSVEANEFK